MKEIDIKKVTEDLERGNCPLHAPEEVWDISRNRALSIFNKISQQNEIDRSLDPSLPKISTLELGKDLMLEVDGQAVGVQFTYDPSYRNLLIFSTKNCEIKKRAAELESGKTCRATETFPETRNQSSQRFDDIARANEKDRANNPSLPKITVAEGKDCHGNPNLKLLLDTGSNKTVVESWGHAYDARGNKIERNGTQDDGGDGVRSSMKCYGGLWSWDPVKGTVDYKYYSDKKEHY